MSVVTALDRRDGQVLYSAELGTEASALAIDERRGRLFVTGSGVDNGPIPSQRGRLTMLDAGTGRVLGTGETGVKPIAIALDDLAHRVLVVNQGPTTAPGSLSIFDDEANLLAELPLDIYPVALALNSKEGLAFVANFVSNTVTVVDFRATRVVKTLSLGPAPGTVARLAFDDRTSHLLAMSFPPRFSKDQPTDGELRIIDTRAGEVLATLVLPNPTEMKLSASTGQVIVTSSIAAESRLTALVVPGGVVAWTRQLEESADAMSIDETAGRVFLMSSEGATVAVVDAKDGRRLCSRKIRDVPRLLAIDNHTHQALVTTTGGTIVAVGADC